MVEAARRQANTPTNIKYVQGHAEDLRGIVDANSVDLLISGSLASDTIKMLIRDSVKPRPHIGSTGSGCGRRRVEFYGQEEPPHSG
jgi:hypothetical protein